MEPLEYFFLFLAGLAGGFLAGLLGIGGGIIYILILPFALQRIGVPQLEIVQYVISNSIFGTLFASLAGNIAEIRNKRFYRNEVLVVGLLGAISALFVLNFVVHTSWYSKEVFNGVVILAMTYIFINVISNSNRQNRFIREIPFSKRRLSLAGVSGGIISALSGLGGGTVIVPILNSAMRMNIKKAKAISLGMIFFSASFMTLFNLLEQPSLKLEAFHIGFIVFPIVIPLSIGVVIASPIAVKVSRKFPSYVISYIFSIFVLIVIIGKSISLYNSLVL